MSDPATSGDSAATAGAAFPAASSGTPAPAGSFGAKGSGLARGKRPSPAAVSTAASAAPSGYQPSALEVLRPQSEYKNPFTGETSVAAPIVNEPAPQAAPVAIAAPVFVPAPVAVQPVVSPVATPVASSDELFPFTPPAAERPRPPLAPAAKAELNILPPEEVKRPAVSWGETAPSQQGRRDERPTFKPERRDARPFEPREPRAPREPGREPASEPRAPFARDHDRDRNDRPVHAQPQKKSGGFLAWLKGLFGGSAQPEVKTGERDHQHGHDGHHRHEGGGRRRHRGGRGRGGYQGGGENRGPRDGQQPREQSPEGGHGGYPGGEHSGEQRFEGGGRRRRRGGRNRNRDDRGPRPEGQQGGGAI